MTLKRVLIFTGIWTLIMVGVCVAAISYAATHRVPGVRAKDRAAQLGSGLGTLTVIGYGAIWLPFAAKVGQKKRAEREEKKRGNAKNPKRRR